MYLLAVLHILKRDIFSLLCVFSLVPVPEKLCELLKCHSPVGSWCQVVPENGILKPKCVCPQSCPR